LLTLLDQETKRKPKMPSKKKPTNKSASDVKGSESPTTTATASAAAAAAAVAASNVASAKPSPKMSKGPTVFAMSERKPSRSQEFDWTDEEKKEFADLATPAEKKQFIERHSNRGRIIICAYKINVTGTVEYGATLHSFNADLYDWNVIKKTPASLRTYLTKDDVEKTFAEFQAKVLETHRVTALGRLSSTPISIPAQFPSVFTSFKKAPNKNKAGGGSGGKDEQDSDQCRVCLQSLPDASGGKASSAASTEHKSGKNPESMTQKNKIYVRYVCGSCHQSVSQEARISLKSKNKRKERTFTDAQLMQWKTKWMQDKIRRALGTFGTHSSSSKYQLYKQEQQNEGDENVVSNAATAGSNDD
jgi:hypothetical protein